MKKEPNVNYPEGVTWFIIPKAIDKLNSILTFKRFIEISKEDRETFLWQNELTAYYNSPETRRLMTAIRQDQWLLVYIKANMITTIYYIAKNKLSKSPPRLSE